MMKKCRFPALFLAIVCLLTLSACSSQSGSTSLPVQPDTQEPTPDPVPIPFALAIYPEYSLHPTLAANRANLTLSPLLYEPLFQLDEAFQPVPVLCQSYTVSEDALTWTFTLRSGVTFSDGTALTGEVVAQALNLARSPEGRFQQRLAHIYSISGKDQTVTVLLNYPNGNLPVLLDIPIALGNEDRPLGTGPYVLSGEEDAPVLTARSDWWQDVSLPSDQLALQPIYKSDELIFSFSTGDVALVDVDLTGTNALGYSGNYETWDYTTTDLIYLGFNTQSGPCRDAQLRQAVARTINRDTVVRTLYANHAIPSALPVHPDSPWYNATLARQLSYNPDPLVEQVAKLRSSNRSVTLLVNNENAAKLSVAQFIAYQLETAGLEVTTKALAFEDYIAALAAGNFDLYVGELVLTADFNLAPLLTGELNYGGWYSESFSALLYALGISNTDSRPQAMNAVLEHLYEQVPISPICFKNGSVLTQWGRLTGLSPVRGNVFYQLENWMIL